MLGDWAGRLQATQSRDWGWGAPAAAVWRKNTGKRCHSPDTQQGLVWGLGRRLTVLPLPRSLGRSSRADRGQGAEEGCVPPAPRQEQPGSPPPKSSQVQGLGREGAGAAN